MTQHLLQGRREDELLWFRRREAVAAAGAWLALGGATTVHAQQRSNVVEYQGDVLLNGQRMLPQQTVQTGDEVQTGPASRLVFTIGNDAFHVRQNSRLSVQRGASLYAVSMLRLLTGAVVSVFGRSNTRRAISTPTITVGIRGTGVYTEVLPTQRSYLCNCYGTVDIASRGDSALSVASYHQAFWAEPEAKGGRFLTPAGAINHTDEELEFLARLVNQRTAWQIAGFKGIKDGKGYMQDRPGQMHPAMMPPLR